MSDVQPTEPEGGGSDQEVEPTAEGPPGEPLTAESLLETLEEVTAQRNEYLATAQRTQADFENFRKLAQRRLEDEVQRALGSFVDRLLPVLDACDAAVAHGSTEAEPIMSALLGALEKEGLVRIDPAGEPFDPAIAEAVVHEPGGGGEHTVAEVLRTGYSWQGRILRPAMVKVTD
ncbi:MAG: nucleotide exchange factor GrpE [Actinomycetota bacterium]|nr:nucleotide exchange factor GrpE [Actinomycetota bacterium]